MNTRFIVTAILAIPSLLLALPARAQSDSDSWRFSVMPYLWLPGMSGSLRYGPPSVGGATPHVSVDGQTLLGALDFGLLLAGEARKGKWMIATDLMYLDLSGDKGGVKSIDFNPGPGPLNAFNTSLSVATTTKLKTSVWSVVGGYNAVNDARVTLDVIGGFRYLNVEASTDWRLSAVVAGPGGGLNFPAAGSVTKSEDLLDGIVGIRGRLKLGGGNWFVPYHLDVGAGSSKLTWQGLLGVGHAYKWGDAVLAYRILSYQMGGNKLIEDMELGGFAIGANFRF